MKRASYRDGVAFIAMNDEAGSADNLRPEVVAELVTSVMLAALFNVDPERVGRDVVNYRKRNG